MESFEMESESLFELTDFESFKDMVNPPQSWKEAMAAVIAGAVDHDEIEAVCTGAALRANELVLTELTATGHLHLVPTNVWYWVTMVAIEDIANGQEPTAMAKGTLEQVGALADEYEGAKRKLTSGTQAELPNQLPLFP
jgi:hypothetical protein